MVAGTALSKYSFKIVLLAAISNNGVMVDSAVFSVILFAVIISVSIFIVARLAASFLSQSAPNIPTAHEIIFVFCVVVVSGLLRMSYIILLFASVQYVVGGAVRPAAVTASCAVALPHNLVVIVSAAVGENVVHVPLHSGQKTYSVAILFCSLSLSRTRLEGAHLKTL